MFNVAKSLSWSAAVFALALAAPAFAQKTVMIPKTGNLCADDPKCHNRWHFAIKPVATADPGDVAIFGTRDAFDHAFNMNTKPADLPSANLNLVHPINGPLFVNGVEPGDVLAVTLIDVEPDKFGYTVIFPGFGFLRDVFTEPGITRWVLNRMEATSPDMPGVRIRMDGFLGTVGVAPGEKEVDEWLERETALGKAGGVALPPQPKDALPKDVCGPNGSHKDKCLRTIPPRENGGNMDVKQMVVGTTMYFPCFVKGCLLSIGDVHFAQGDGEVSGTAIEMDATVTVKVDVIKGGAAKVKRPQFSGADQLKRLAPARFHAVVGYPFKKAGEVPPQFKYLNSEPLKGLTNLNEDLTAAARDSLLQMVDWLVANKGLNRNQAYMFASVACDLRISNVVDVPNYAVTTICDLTVFDK
jgi:formamidase